jgi:hypothetical protein
MIPKNVQEFMSNFSISELETLRPVVLCQMVWDAAIRSVKESSKDSPDLGSNQRCEKVDQALSSHLVAIKGHELRVAEGVFIRLCQEIKDRAASIGFK